MDTSISSDNGKKVPLEDLSKEDLVKKCRALLGIAQKARLAKDTLQEENDQLKLQIEESSLKQNNASAEIIENLTQQKLDYVTKIEDSKKQISILNNKLETSLQELCASEQKVNTLDNENISFKRQVKRLTTENEQLITDLESLEKQLKECKELGLEQQNQLLALEETKPKKTAHNEDIQIMVNNLKNESGRLKEKIANLIINLAEKDKNIITVSEDLQLEKQLVADLRKQSESSEKEKADFEALKLQNIDLKEANLSLQEDMDKNFAELTELRATLNEISEKTLKELNSIIEKLKNKVTLYRSKIVKFAGNVKELKENKNQVLELFKIYTNQVEEWKIQLISSSHQLMAHITKLGTNQAELCIENQLLKESNAKFIKQLEAHKTDDEKSKDIAMLEAIKSDNVRLSDEIALLVEVQDAYKAQIEELRAETAAETEIQTRLDENERICLEYRKIITKLEAETGENSREIAELKSRNSLLQAECEHSKATEQQFAEKTSEEILKLVQENAQLLAAQQKRRTEVGTQTQDSEQAELATTLKRDNSVLLSEMNEMNQALKERGEAISELQAHCEEIQKKIQLYETKANRNDDNITLKDQLIGDLEQKVERQGDELRAKNAEIDELKTELEQLKEQFNADSETMSSSTISRMEEASRLKDLEGSWEERYVKLRNLAIKLKGKIRELTAQLAKEQNEAVAKCTSSAKTIQTQCDKMQDELEHAEKEKKIQLESLTQANQKVGELESQMLRLRKELEELKTEKNSTEAWKKQVSAKVQALRKETEANKILKNEFEARIAKLTGELEAKELALKTEAEQHEKTRSSLEQSNKESKKTSVLNLEMQDYERSVKELILKLEKKKDEIIRLQNQVDSQKSTINAVREQNKLQEQQILAGEGEIEATKAEVIVYKKQLADLEELIELKDGKIQSFSHIIETTRSENEDLATELSKVISEHQKVSNALKSEKEYFRSQTLGLQQSLRETQDTLKLKEDELGSIKADYESYKVRAQSVLRQNQSRDVGLEEKLGEEVATLQLRCDNLNTELKQSQQVIETLKGNNERLQLEKKELAEKLRDSSSEMENLTGLYDQLTSKHNQAVIEHGETVRNLKVHAETLSQCYRQQISEQEVRHNREIIEMQSKMEKAPSPTEFPFPVLSTMHREEGEGSESTEGINKSVTYPVPLERLLGGDQDQELLFIRKQLAEEEMKVMHLTELLADTEQDLAKHTQMNKMLKEEIRRQQRSVEREKHAENLEYLKNVVFKFVTLHSGDERVRLVPVLNTILKLSPEETQKLNLVAKGDLRGWSNYLPIWPSSSKS